MKTGSEGNSYSPVRGMTSRTADAIFWMFSANSIRMVLKLVVMAILARLILPEEFGLLAAALIIVSFAEIFSMLGIGPAVVQRPELETRHIRTGFTISVLLGLFLGGMTWLVAPLVAGFFRMTEVIGILRVLVLAFPLEGLSVVASAIQRRELQFRRIAGIQLISYIIGYAGIGITLALMEFGVWALVGATLAETAVKTILLLIVQPHPKRPLLEPDAAKELLYFGGGLTFARICNYFAWKGDSLVVGRWLGPAALGFYDRAYLLMGTATTAFGRVLDTVLFPALSRVQKEPDRLQRAYIRGIALMALIVLPMSAILWVFAPEVVYVLLGPDWSDVVVPFQILAIGMVFRPCYRISAFLALACGAVYRMLWRQVVHTALILGGAWVGQRWGISGVAVGVLLALAVHFVLMSQLSLSLISMTWRDLLPAYSPAGYLSVILLAELLPVATVLRSFSLSPVLVLFASGLIALITLLILLRIAPKLFIGHDSLSLLSTLVDSVPDRFRLIRRFKKGFTSVLNHARA